MREQPVLPAGQEHRVEFEALRAVQRHDRDPVLVLAIACFHDERDMLEERAHVGKFLHRADELFEVVEPARGIGRAIRLPHIGVAGFLEDLRRDLGVRRALLEPLGPAEMAMRRSRSETRGLGFSSSDCASASAARNKGMRAAARMIVQERERRLGEAALRRIDDALEGEIVRGLVTMRK